MKRKYISLFVFLFFISISNVCAKEVTCNYKNVKDNTTISTLIGSTDASIGINGIKSESGPFYGNNTSFSYPGYGIDETDLFTTKQTTAQEAYENIGCPTYFYLLYTEAGSYLGYYSDIDERGIKRLNSTFFNNIHGIYETTASQVGKNSDGTISEKEKSYACELYAKLYDNSDYKTQVSINYTKKNIEFTHGNSDYLKQYIKEFNYKKENKCPTDLFVCYQSLDSKLYYITNKDNMNYCYKLTKTTKKIETGKRYCQLYYDLLGKYKTAKKNNQISSANKTLTTLKTFCKDVTASVDYSNYEYSCINLCLNINDDLPESLSSPKDCGLSARIIAFIYNILKWVKYIAPVLVIILGILDFVKALAAQDDDAMKKAQGKFVKRMIAAVLLFLLPLIIDYVLSVFHLVNDSCNINKIF